MILKDGYKLNFLEDLVKNLEVSFKILQESYNKFIESQVFQR